MRIPDGGIGASLLIAASLFLQSCAGTESSGAPKTGSSMEPAADPQPVLAMEGYLRQYNFIKYSGKYYALPQSEGAFVLQKVQNKRYRESYVSDTIEGLKRQIMETMAGPNQNDSLPLLIAEGYKDRINIIRYHGKYYGLGQEEGPFAIEKVIKKQYKRCFLGDSPIEVDGQLH
jgi:hypothetical protein